MKSLLEKYMGFGLRARAHRIKERMEQFIHSH